MARSNTVTIENGKVSRVHKVRYSGNSVTRTEESYTQEWIVIENDVVCQLDDDVSGNLQCQPDNKVCEPAFFLDILWKASYNSDSLRHPQHSLHWDLHDLRSRLSLLRFCQYTWTIVINYRPCLQNSKENLAPNCSYILWYFKAHSTRSLR
jgi:hypothetical protein